MNNFNTVNNTYSPIIAVKYICTFKRIKVESTDLDW